MSAPLPVTPAHELANEIPPRPSYLVDVLWTEGAVGVLGGEPKCGKSFLALQLAVAVASGTNCLDRFSVTRPAPALVFPAEDNAEIVRRRLDGICRRVGVALDALDLGIISCPVLRLDCDEDRQRLAQTIRIHRPALLVLDPFVRLHTLDENASGDVAPMLAFLRQLQREFGVAILVVHHARKGGNGMRPGQALRGSSEFHAWGDSNLYLRRKGQQLLMGVEHRGAPSVEALALELVTDPQGSAYLELRDLEPEPDKTPSPEARVLDALAAIDRPVSRAELRDACRIKTATLSQILAALVLQGRILRDSQGFYRRAD